jgi:F-type H+-transporting ATPase subunit delta
VITRRKLASHIADEWVDGGADRTHLIQQMAAFLVEEGRTNEVDLLVNDIKIEIEQRYGITVADVHSAHPLNEQIKKAITEMVKSKTGAKSVRMSEAIDESLIGGVVVDTPTMSIDMSVRGKLNKLRSHL